MENNYVSREEFNLLKQEVQDIKKETEESQKLLRAIDKKIDVIDEKIVSSDKIETLKFAPLEKRVDNLEDSQKWLRRTILGSVIALVFEAVGLVIAFLKSFCKSVLPSTLVIISFSIVSFSSFALE